MVRTLLSVIGAVALVTATARKVIEVDGVVTAYRAVADRRQRASETKPDPALSKAVLMAVPVQ